LSALNSGTYISGGTDITVDKVTSGSSSGAYRISYTGSATPTTVESTNNYLVVTKTNNTYKIEFNTAELVNYIGGTKGLQVDPAYSNKILISPKRQVNFVAYSEQCSFDFNALQV
jgi:hypothetical protein